MEKSFDDIEQKVVELLVNLGVARSQAMIIVCLARERDGVYTAKVMEETTGCIQSVVSGALISLVDKGIVLRSGRVRFREKWYMKTYDLVPVVSFMVRSIKDRISRYNIDVPKKEEVKKYKFNF